MFTQLRLARKIGRSWRVFSRYSWWATVIIYNRCVVPSNLANKTRMKRVINAYRRCVVAKWWLTCIQARFRIRFVLFEIINSRSRCSIRFPLPRKIYFAAKWDSWENDNLAWNIFSINTRVFPSRSLNFMTFWHCARVVQGIVYFAAKVSN